jgi:nucleotide-binding universal stress UspA family protein
MSIASVLVHVDVDRDSEARVQLSLHLADRLGAVLIGLAGLAPRPAFAAGGLAVYTEPTAPEVELAVARLEEMGGRFRTQGQFLRQVEWRSAVELPARLVVRESRAADLLVIGPRRRGDPLNVDPGVVVLRAGRPVLVVPDAAAPLGLRRVLVACKDTRECRRAVRDAIPILQHAREVLLVEISENEASPADMLADVGRYLVRHGVVIAGEMRRRAPGPTGSELLRLAREENADLMVAGAYGHSRLGEWIMGGVTRDLLEDGRLCCLLSH